MNDVTARAAARLMGELARPRPRVFVFSDLDGLEYTQREDPLTGQRLYALTGELYAQINDQLMLEQGQRLENFCEVSYEDGHSATYMSFAQGPPLTVGSPPSEPLPGLVRTLVRIAPF